MITAPIFHRAQLVKDGPMVGVKIWRGFPTDPVTREVLERAWKLRAEVNGVEVDVASIAPWLADGTGSTIPGEPIAEAAYEFYCQDRAWAKTYAPTDPAANPRKKVDMSSMPPIPWK